MSPTATVPSLAPVDWGRLGQKCLDAISASKTHKDDWTEIQEAGQALAEAAERLQNAGRIADLHAKIGYSRESLERMEAELEILKAPVGYPETDPATPEG